MTIKYPAWACTLALVAVACTPQAIAPVPSPSPTATLSASPSPGLAAVVPATITTERHWYSVPDGLDRSPARITVTFAADVTAGRPYVEVAGTGAAAAPVTRAVLVLASGNTWTADVALDALTAGPQQVRVIEQLSGNAAQTVATGGFMLTQPEYVVWTLDFEGDAAGDPELTNTATIADELKIPMSVFWNPRVWTTSDVTPERQEAMLAWTKGRLAKGDEVALHLHMWTDYVRAVGLVPRTAPSWAGRGDGYDVPITAYPENEQQAMIGYGVKLMIQHGLPTPTSFRAGGDFADAATLRAVAASGFNADCTAVAKDYPPIGRIPYPWTLPVGAQPYQPSRTDANATGDLPLLEAPTIGGNTYGFTIQTIQPQVKANLALFAAPGAVAAQRTTITVVSHPGTIVPTEFTAIESLLGSFGSLRYDLDRGPVRFVTMAQLAKAFGR